MNDDKFFTKHEVYTLQNILHLTHEHKLNKRSVVEFQNFNDYFILESARVTICPLYVAIINHDENAVKKLIEYDVDPSAKYSTNLHPNFEHGRSWTYLSFAINENYVPIVKILLRDIRVVRSIYKQGYQPLRWCLSNIERTDVLSMIMDVLEKDKNEPTESDMTRIRSTLENTSNGIKIRNDILIKEKKDILPSWFKYLYDQA